MHGAVIWAALFLAAFTMTPPRRRPLVHALAVIYVVGAGISTVLINENKFALYQKDLRLAERIVAGLERNARFDSARPIAIVGHIGPKSAYMAGISTYYRVIDTKFAFGWAQLETLEEASGRNFTGAGKQFCRTAAKVCDIPWDSSQTFSTSVTTKGAIICLPQRGLKRVSYCQVPVR